MDATPTVPARPERALRPERTVTRRTMVRAGALGAIGGGAGLAACRSADAPGTGGGESASLVSKPVTIEVGHPFTPENPDADGRYMPTLLQRLPELSPNLKVQENIDAGPPKLIAMAAAGTPPDVAAAYVLQGTTYASQKLAVPLESLLKSAKDWSADDFIEGAREAFTYGSDLLFAPFLVAPMAITVNQEMLDRASLKLPAPNWTWDDFSEYATRLTQRSGSDVAVYGAALPYTPNTNIAEYFGSLLWSHGGDWADRKTGVITYQRPEGVAALETWVNLTLKQRAAPAVEPDNWKPFGARPATRGGLALANGLVAMSFAYAPGVLEYQKVVPQALRWTTVAMPRRKGPGSHFYGCSWFVVNGAKNREGAAEFVRVATLPDTIAQWNMAAYSMVTRKSAAARQEWQQHLKRQPLLGAYAVALAYTRTYPALAGWGEVMQGEGGLGPAVYDAAQGKVAPKPALEDSARVGEAILAKFK